MRTRFILFFALVVTLQTVAQQAATRQPVMLREVQVGLLEGEAGSAFQLMANAGLQWQQFALSAGAGLDYYGIRSIPVYLQGRYRLGAGKAPFLFAGGGMHFPWAGNKEENLKQENKAGAYYEAGIGYRFPLRSNAFSLGLAYSGKAYETQTFYPRFCIWGDCGTDVQTKAYHLRRLMFRLGFQF